MIIPTFDFFTFYTKELYNLLISHNILISDMNLEYIESHKMLLIE